MLDSKLILIEGFTGSGKSTTAKYLAKVLSENGRFAKSFHEYAADNPINPFFTNIIRKNNGRFPGWEEVEASISDDDPNLYTLSQWEQLTQKQLQSEEIIILESMFWQHGPMIHLFLAQSATQIIDYHQKIVAALKDIKPVLIHLFQPNVEEAIRRTYAGRSEEWAKSTIAFCEQLPYFRKNKLVGMGGMFQFYHAWHSIEMVLFERYPYPKISLLNPHDDWQRAYHTLHTSLGLT